MATRITYQFISFYNETYRVDIDDADYVGDALDVDVAPDGFTLRYDGETDSVNPGVVGSSVSCSILVTPDNATDIETFVSDVITSDETRFTIAIYKITAGPTTSLYWAGYVISDLGSFEDVGDSYFLTIKAVDGLARLKNVNYESAGVPVATSSFLDHIYNCLSEIGTTALYWSGTDVFLRTVVNWQDGNMYTATAAKDPLLYSRVSGEVFAKKAKSNDADDWDFDDIYKVIQKICQNWGARLMLSNGAWRFEQVRERMEENFFERRYDNNGSFLSSTNAAGYDKAVIQTGDANRLRGGQFNYLPALSKVEVLYDHKTYRNYLQNLGFKWYNGSGSNTPFARSGFNFDADTLFKVRGKLSIDVSVVSYTKPWRYVYGMIVKATPGNYRIKMETTAVGTPGVPTVTNGPITWEVASVYFEITTPWIYSSKFKGEANWPALTTPFIPTGQTGFEVDFIALGGRDYDGNNVSATVNDWRVSDTELLIYGNDAASNFEVARRYLSNNVNPGNSDALKIETNFGHAVYGWTPCKIETTDDDTFVDWDDTTATWERANENTAAEFGQLLSYQTLQLQTYPVETYSGTLSSAGIHAHSRIVFPDDSTWLINRGEWQAKPNLWDVEMMKTAIADGADIDIDTPIGLPGGDEIPGIITPGIAVASPDGLGTTTATGFEGKTALAFLTGNTVSTHIATGTITSIPVDEPVKANSLFDGDLIFVVDPQSGQTFTFTVDGNVTGGATSITVTSTAITSPIPIGAQVIPSPLNLYTTSGGSGTSGTVSGSGAANHIAYWSSGSALTGESALYYDPTNNRLGVNQSSPQKRISIVTANSLDGIRIESDGTLDQDPGRIELMGTATGPYIQRGFIALDVYSNAGALPDGQALYFQLQRDSGTLYTAMALYNNQAIFNNASGFNIANNSGRLRFQSSSAGIFNTDNNWLLTTSAQTTNDANSRLKIVSIGTTSSNYGLRVYNSTPTLIFAVRDDQHVGVNVDPADAIVQLKGLGTTTAKTLLVENSSGTDNFYVQDSGLVSGVAYQSVSAAPTVTYGAAAGTGPTTVLISGAQNGVNIFFTTGTSPSANTTVMTVNLPKSFANGCAASWLAYNAATQPIIGNFWLSGTSQNSITIAYAGTLAASTDYALSITIMGF